MERRFPRAPPKPDTGDSSRSIARRAAADRDRSYDAASGRDAPEDRQKKAHSAPSEVIQPKLVSRGKSPDRPTTSPISIAGIVTNTDTQTRVIPQSVRADGSVRKERRVREGFVPKEDIAKYRPGQGRLRDRQTPGVARNDSIPSSAGKKPPRTAEERVSPPEPPQETTTRLANARKKPDGLDEALAKLSLGDTSSSRWA